MNDIIKIIFKILMGLAVFFIVVKDIGLYINYKIDMQAYETMAKKYNCTFLTPSASKADIGMFDCQDHIVFKKLEN
jgi:hypothetical protein